MQTSEASQEEPPLVDINLRDQSYEVYVVSTDAVAEGTALAAAALSSSST
jgi:hypothetical protein